MLKKYISKPTVKEAYLLTEENAIDVMSWCDECAPFLAENETGIIIPTLEGNHLANWGDYVVKGIHGEFYPVKPDVFRKSYDEAPND